MLLIFQEVENCYAECVKGKKDEDWSESSNRVKRATGQMSNQASSRLKVV